MQKYADRPKVFEKDREQLKQYPELLQELLISRGVLSTSDAEAFLSPDYERHVHDPFLMKGMERAVLRVLYAIEHKEPIVIYSDYDCDGIPGGVLLHDFFNMIGYENVSNYIPHRHEEGYGVNEKAISALVDGGAKLIITVDCGITDVSPIAYAQGRNVDVIVTDHHLPGEVLPPAHVVLNPKQEGDTYPEPMLCGSGVAFKLVQGVLSRNRFSLKEGKEKWLLDMVGLATIADMVPLRGENRVFAHFGLAVLRKSPRPGLQKLCRKMKVNQRYLTEDDIGFMLAPRINAASRMDEPMAAFRLLATLDEVEADMQATHLNKINDQRKGLVASMAREIKKRVQSRMEEREIIVTGDPRWRPALLGLVANSLVEEYNRPVFLWGREGSNLLKGSCRSDGSVDVVLLMNEVKDILIGSGGHAFAGGFSVSEEGVHTLEAELTLAYRKVKNKSTISNSAVIDRRISIDDVTWETYKVIEKLAPFGEGNTKPIFLFPNVTINEIRRFGSDNAHLELNFLNGFGKKISAVDFFSRNSAHREIEQGASINLVASIEKSMFRNFPELRLRIIDIV